MGDDDFNRRVAKLRAEIVGQVAGLLVANAAKSVARLIKLNDDEDHAIGRRAAKELLEMTLRFIEAHDIANHVAALAGAIIRTDEK